MLNWIAENKEWIFSGIGVAMLVFLYKCIVFAIKRRINKQRQEKGEQRPVYKRKKINLGVKQGVRTPPRRGAKKGYIKWFNPEKGYGFISIPNEDDVCLISNSIVDKNTLPKQGQAVEFEVVQGAKGPQAAHVTFPKTY